MAEWHDVPITAEISSGIGTGLQTATIQLSSGLHEVLCMRAGVNTAVAYAQRTSMGFYMIRGDGSIVYQAFQEGWMQSYHDVVLQGSRYVVGPGCLYAQTKFDESNSCSLVVTYRRVLP